jgi:hypothetical protein
VPLVSVDSLSLSLSRPSLPVSLLTGSLPFPAPPRRPLATPLVCVECFIGKQKKPILFKVTEPSSIPYRTPSACAKRAAYPDPPPVIPVPDTGVAQVTTSPGRGLLAEQDRDD